MDNHRASQKSGELMGDWLPGVAEVLMAVAVRIGFAMLTSCSVYNHYNFCNTYNLSNQIGQK